jgi:hypothetical protein
LGWGPRWRSGQERRGPRTGGAAVASDHEESKSLFRDHTANCDGKHVDLERTYGTRKQLRNLCDRQKELVAPLVDRDKLSLSLHKQARQANAGGCSLTGDGQYCSATGYAPVVAFRSRWRSAGLPHHNDDLAPRAAPGLLHAGALHFDTRDRSSPTLQR